MRLVCLAMQHRNLSELVCGSTLEILISWEEWTFVIQSIDSVNISGLWGVPWKLNPGASFSANQWPSLVVAICVGACFFLKNKNKKYKIVLWQIAESIGSHFSWWLNGLVVIICLTSPFTLGKLLREQVSRSVIEKIFQRKNRA